MAFEKQNKGKLYIVKANKGSKGITTTVFEDDLKQEIEDLKTGGYSNITYK